MHAQCVGGAFYACVTHVRVHTYAGFLMSKYGCSGKALLPIMGRFLSIGHNA